MRVESRDGTCAMGFEVWEPVEVEPTESYKAILIHEFGQWLARESR